MAVAERCFAVAPVARAVDHFVARLVVALQLDRLVLVLVERFVDA